MSKHPAMIGTHRSLELRSTKPLQMKPLALSETALTIALANADKFARVHVFASRYEPTYPVFDYLGVSATANRGSPGDPRTSRPMPRAGHWGTSIATLSIASTSRSSRATC